MVWKSSGFLVKPLILQKEVYVVKLLCMFMCLSIQSILNFEKYRR